MFCQFGVSWNSYYRQVALTSESGIYYLDAFLILSLLAFVIFFSNFRLYISNFQNPHDRSIKRHLTPSSKVHLSIETKIYKFLFLINAQQLMEWESIRKTEVLKRKHCSPALCTANPKWPDLRPNPGHNVKRLSFFSTKWTIPRAHAGETH
jgi:hypothetical protein